MFAINPLIQWASTLHYKLKVDTDSFLGKGTSGTVFKGTLAYRKQRRVDVAVKVPSSLASRDALVKEAGFWQSPAGQTLKNHPNVVSPIIIGTDGAVYPLWNSTLKQYVEQIHSSCLHHWEGSSVMILKPLVSNFVSVLKAMNAVGVSHRDIKPENVVVETGSDGRLCKLALIDWQSVEMVGAQASMVGTTIMYQAPEVALGLPTHPTSDLFSVSLVLLKVLLNLNRTGGLLEMVYVVRPTASDIRWLMQHIAQPEIRARFDDCLCQAMNGWKKTFNMWERVPHLQFVLDALRQNLRLCSDHRLGGVGSFEKRMEQVFDEIPLAVKFKPQLLLPDFVSCDPSKMDPVAVARHSSGFFAAVVMAALWRERPFQDEYLMKHVLNPAWELNSDIRRAAHSLYFGDLSTFGELPTFRDVFPRHWLPNLHPWTEQGFEAVCNWAGLAHNFPESSVGKLTRNSACIMFKTKEKNVVFHGFPSPHMVVHSQ